MTAALAILAAFGLDAAFGEPPNALHPVAWMGRAIACGRSWALVGGRAVQFLKGAAVVAVVTSLSALVAAAVAHLVTWRPWIAPIGTALALKPMFAVRSLREAAFRVRDAVQGGDLAAARRALGSLCSRDASHLGPRELVAAAIESIAENTSDSVIAPLLYFALFGLPGAAFYRAANTVDAMMGYRGALEWTGKAGARLDDWMNLVPARVTALLLVVAGGLVGADARRGLAIWRRDGGRTESPNAGRPMAAMAGLLGVRLAKSGCYELGDDVRAIQASDVTLAWRIAWVASWGAAVLVSVCLVVLAQFARRP